MFILRLCKTERLSGEIECSSKDPTCRVGEACWSLAPDNSESVQTFVLNITRSIPEGLELFWAADGCARCVTESRGCDPLFAAASTNFKVNVKAGASVDSSVEAMHNYMGQIEGAENKSEAFVTESNFDNEPINRRCQAQAAQDCHVFRKISLFRTTIPEKFLESFMKVYLEHYLTLDFQETTNNKETTGKLVMWLKHVNLALSRAGKFYVSISRIGDLSQGLWRANEKFWEI